MNYYKYRKSKQMIHIKHYAFARQLFWYEVQDRRLSVVRHTTYLMVENNDAMTVKAGQIFPSNNQLLNDRKLPQYFDVTV